MDYLRRRWLEAFGGVGGGVEFERGNKIVHVGIGCVVVGRQDTRCLPVERLILWLGHVEVMLKDEMGTDFQG